jgi:hypothetical protein
VRAGDPIMPRLPLVLAALALASVPRAARADAFDLYINTILEKVPTAASVKEVKQLTPALLADHAQVLPNTAAAFVVVKTNEGRYSKLLVQAARQKTTKGTVPILLIERFVTYKDGQERAVQVQGQNVRLFAGFQLNLDIGQVVPPSIGGDLQFVSANGKTYAEPVGKARFYLLTKPLPEAAPKKADKFVIGTAFEPRYFTGAYKLYDDGRRSGTLHLQVGDKNQVTGSYYSDKDGRKYPVSGKVGNPPHAIQFTIVFPRTRQVFQGWMFTGDGKAITGSSRLQDRDTGFFAVRLAEEK